MGDRTMQRLGERVHTLRRRLRMSQKELADAIGASPTTVSNLEQGKLSTIHVTHLVGLARMLGVSSDYLLGLLNVENEEGELEPAGVALVGA